MRSSSCLFVLLALTALSNADDLPEATTVQPEWELGPEHFCEPETVVWDRKHGVYLVSNVCDYQTPGGGFVSRIDEDGVMLDRVWIDGLDAPVGMLIDGDDLWIVDRGVVRKHAAADGRELEVIAITGAKALNDLTILDGVIYVSDSFRSAVYAVQGGTPSLLVTDERLLWANGMASRDGQLLVGGEHLFQIDPAKLTFSERIGPPALRDFDGIEIGAEGELILSLVGGPVVVVSGDGAVSVVRTEGLSSANLAYRSDLRLAIVPQGTGGGVVAFRLPGRAP